MFLKELLHDTIKLGKKRLNGHYLLILSFEVGVGNFFLWNLLLLLGALLRSHLLIFRVRVGGFIPCALSWVLHLLLGTSFGHETHGWWRKWAFTLDGNSGDFFIIGGVFFFLLLFIIFIIVVVGDPLTNIGTPPVLEVLLFVEGCLALVLVLVLKLLGLIALGRDVVLLTTIVALDLATRMV